MNMRKWQISSLTVALVLATAGAVTAFALASGRSTATYTVVLDAAPASDVVIGVTASGSPDVTVDTDGATSGNQNTLTFTTSDWSTPKTVTVSAAQGADAVNDAAAISHAVDAAGSADEYDGVTVAGVTVTVTDDETVGVTVSPTSVTASEGSTATYTVKLNVQPTSSVVIGVTASGSPDVTVDTDGATSGNQNTLTFTTSDWSTPKTVTVSAAQGADAVNDAAAISHAVNAAGSADEYDDVTVAGVTVTVTDDDAGVSPPDQSPPDQSPTFASRTVDDQVGLHSRRRRRDGDPALRSSGRRQAAIQLVARPARGAALQLGPHRHRHARGDVPQDAVHLYRERYRR